MLNKHDVRVLGEGFLVTFVGALVLYVLRHHVVLALLCGIATCLIVIAITVILEKRDDDRATTKVEHKKWIYGVLIKVGDIDLKRLDLSLRRSANGATGLEMDQEIIHNANECHGWMMNALVEVEDVAGKSGTTAFTKHGLKRQRPSYVGSDLPSQRWTETASRLDWLVDELGKL